ncbi:unnamed protein product [Rhizopus stolonifer]
MMPTEPYIGNNNNYSPFQCTDIDDKKSIISRPLPPPPPPPFMIPPLPFDGDMSRPRKRTRTSPEQLAILEESFNLNPSPNSRTREQLSLQLGMPERSIQIWFQNRRAKVKNQAKRTMQVQDKKLYMQQQYAASAATAACQSAAVQRQQSTIDPDLYNYYYYYYFQQIQQQQQQQANEPYFAKGNTHLISPPPIASNWNNNTTPDLVLSASTSSSSTASRSSYKKHPTLSSERTRAHSVGPYPYYHRKTQHERHASLGPPTSHPSYTPYMSNQLYTSILEEPQTTLLEQIYPLTTETLQIGTWKRVCHLQCQIDLTKRKLIWIIGGDDDDNEGQRFRMDIDFNLIQSILILNTGIEFLLHSPQQIQFYMTTTTNNNNQWIQCHDFTQDQQGSCVHLHQLQGFGLSMEIMEVLLQAPELEALVQDDSMTNNMLLLQDLHLP